MFKQFASISTKNASDNWRQLATNWSKSVLKLTPTYDTHF
jgi:hypothetical protein